MNQASYISSEVGRVYLLFVAARNSRQSSNPISGGIIGAVEACYGAIITMLPNNISGAQDLYNRLVDLVIGLQIEGVSENDKMGVRTKKSVKIVDTPEKKNSEDNDGSNGDPDDDVSKYITVN